MSVESPGPDPFLDDYFQEMRRARSPLRDASDLSARKARALPALAAVVAARGRFRRRLAWAGGAVALAAGVGLAWSVGPGLLQSSASSPGAVAPLARSPLSVQLGAAEGQVRVRGPSGARSTAGGDWADLGSMTSLREGGGLRTESDASIELKTDSGVALVLSGNSELALGPGLEAIYLAAGSVTVDAPRLGPGQGFQVETRGGRAIVHGTQFSVTILEEAALPCVVVNEGVVEVVPSSRAPSGAPPESYWVRAGESLGCALPGERAYQEQAQPIGRDGQAAPAHVGGKRAPRASAGRELAPHGVEAGRGQSNLAPEVAATGVALSEQNRLFQKALLAEQQGRLSEAARTLDQLVARFPASPLVEQFRAQRRSVASRMAEKSGAAAESAASK